MPPTTRAKRPKKSDPIGVRITLPDERVYSIWLNEISASDERALRTQCGHSLSGLMGELMGSDPGLDTLTSFCWFAAYQDTGGTPPTWESIAATLTFESASGLQMEDIKEDDRGEVHAAN